jgi:hypothetical protein
MTPNEGDIEENGALEAATWKSVLDRDGRGRYLALCCNNCGEEIEPGQVCECQEEDR